MKLALAGDTMLGRGVGELLASRPPSSLFAPEVVEAAREADLFVLNLECCISKRGSPWPGRVFHFRAPPVAVEALVHLGVDCVTLANNHALDFGEDALADTLEHLRAAGIACVGAGPDARAPIVLQAAGTRLGVLGFTDHPHEYVAHVAYADLAEGLPGWVVEAIRGLDADTVLVTPHWGPNMTAEPVPHVRRAAEELVAAGATLVAGHSAHVFHGVAGRVLYDLGDFVDDYHADPVRRNDLGLLWLVEPGVAVEAVPLKLEYAHTRLADGEDVAWIARRFRAACAALGTEVEQRNGRLVVELATFP